MFKKRYRQDLVKSALNMAIPAMVESFFIAFAGLVDSYMVTGLSANDTSCNIIEESALKDSSSLSGLNFETTWTMEGNTLYDYPELKLLNHIVVEKQLSAGFFGH